MYCPGCGPEVVIQKPVGDIPPSPGSRLVRALESDPVGGDLDGDSGAYGIEDRVAFSLVDNRQFRVGSDLARILLTRHRQRRLHPPRTNRPKQIESGSGYAIQFVAERIETGLKLVGEGAYAREVEQRVGKEQRIRRPADQVDPGGQGLGGPAVA